MGAGRVVLALLGVCLAGPVSPGDEWVELAKTDQATFAVKSRSLTYETRGNAYLVETRAAEEAQRQRQQK